MRLDGIWTRLKDIKNTLKEEGGDGHTYSPEQQKLMVWYTYFFLNRGKPSTHIAALSQLSDEELKENVPPVLQRLIETADHILKGDKMIMMLAMYIIETNPYIKQALQMTYSFVFLDEFQDTTAIQYAFVKEKSTR